MSVVLRAKDIRVSFRKEQQSSLFGQERQQVLHDISLDLREGECLGIIGESGSGKSTLGRVLSGLLKPEGGRVYLEGSDIYEKRSAKSKAALQHRMALVFQDYTSSVNPRFRVENIIGESLRIYRKAGGDCSHVRQRTYELLDQVGLPASFITRYPHELSGGQLQRVCIARALAVCPRIILLDEAISSLDASTQVQIMDLLSTVQKSLGLSYIFITHDLTSITYLCNRVLFFQHGRIVEQVDQISQLSSLQTAYAKHLLHSIMGLGVSDSEQEQADLLVSESEISSLALVNDARKGADSPQAGAVMAFSSKPSVVG